MKGEITIGNCISIKNNRKLQKPYIALGWITIVFIICKATNKKIVNGLASLGPLISFHNLFCVCM